MILESLVTTRTPAGALHLAPMGPHIEADFTRLRLRPFQTAQTCRNLQAHGEGVVHVVDDVLLLAQAAIGAVTPAPPTRPAEVVQGWILTQACRAYEFRVVTADPQMERATFVAEVVRVHRQHDFFGFNRGKHAVVEAAILATRLHLLPRADVVAEFARLAVWVQKTGGPTEHAAFAVLQAHLERSPP
jgi:hypothetical protein